MKIDICSIELPKGIHGITAMGGKKLVVYINENDPLTERLKTYYRGIARVRFGHFNSDKPYMRCDKEAEDFAIECLAHNKYQYITY